jgi:hypothetical protein
MNTVRAMHSIPFAARFAHTAGSGLGLRRVAVSVIYIYQSIYFLHFASMFLAPVVVKYLKHVVVTGLNVH